MDKLIFRTTEFPTGWSLNTNEQSSDLEKDKHFAFALFLASPALYKQIENTDKKSGNLEFSLKKYESRAKYRSTPFGLFASCSAASWGEKNQFNLNVPFSTVIEFDMHLYGALVQQILEDSEAKIHLLYRFNHSVYLKDEKLRYIEFYYKKGRRYHKISQTDFNQAIAALFDFCQHQKTFDEIKAFLIQEFEVTDNEADEYLSLLIAEKLIISNVYVRGIVVNSLKELEAQLPPAINNKYGIADLITQLDLMSQDNFEKQAQRIKEILTDKGISFEEKFLFQAVAFRTQNEFKLDRKYKYKIDKAIQFLDGLNPAYLNRDLETFKSKFTETYGDSFVPLMHVLDPSNGLGYPIANSSQDEESPFDDIRFPPRTESYVDLRYYPVHQVLFGKLVKALKKGERIIELTEKDQFKNDKKWTDQLPLSFAAMWSITAENKIYMKSVGGSSAASLLGRFGNANPEIEQIIKSIVEKENEILKGNVILSEINHVPEDRVGNVIQRPMLREYDIPIMTYSCHQNDKSIALNNLFLTVKDNRVVLFDKVLNKVVVPRLMNAHNFTRSKIPAYRFLSELQFQDTKAGISFSWGVLEKQFFYFPRVVYQDIILHPEMWKFGTFDLPFLQSNAQDTIFDWQKENKIPNQFYLVEGDNALLIDVNDPVSLATFLNEIKNKNEITLHEFLGHADIDGLNDRVNEFISTHFNDDFYFPPFNNPSAETNVEFKFKLGEDWIYNKLYCKASHSDLVLAHYILPTLQQLKSEELIETFFFIKYSDPNEHLRLRCRVKETNAVSVNAYLNKLYENLSSAGLIDLVVHDQYIREINRYGLATIDWCEKWFEHDSVAVLNFIRVKLLDSKLDRWKYGLASINALLNDFGLDAKQKLETSKHLADGFRAEFKVNKAVNKNLDRKYRKLEKEIEELLTIDTIYSELLLQRSLNSKTVIEKIKNHNEGKNVHELLPSLIHMLMNRIFISHQRRHEVVLYDMLYRFYKKAYFKKT